MTDEINTMVQIAAGTVAVVAGLAAAAFHLYKIKDLRDNRTYINNTRERVRLRAEERERVRLRAEEMKLATRLAESRAEQNP